MSHRSNLYRRKPGTVTAEQWLPCAGSRTEMPVPPAPSSAIRRRGRLCGGVRWQVKTIHGQWTDIRPLDWIVMEPDGKHAYPVKPDIFEATYQRADDLAERHAEAVRILTP